MRDYKPGTQLTGDAREKTRREAARLYETGMTVDQVAAAIGRSKGGTLTLLHEAGAQMRARGGIRKADA
ncbi:helix-turn-helix domain-containing protein [Streptomyces scabiei]|uniref:helix-turn-helix domain-containing protein n=1 Tax=Streptomyces scabiei TaxID=1930 RepID=UPI0029BF6898|nr:helix-turn-helix domain-containing protein [Streptomyces scabiei]MDX3520763.1 helix-turn-helix domain-containing protein [Streptomyces scabiei]